MKIYQIDSSARKKGSTSRALAKKLLDKIKKPEDEVIYRDLDDEMLFVSGLTESGMNIDEKDQTEEHKKMFELSDKLVKELKESDVIIISAPIYNYGPPATLKAWSDLAARIGETFRFKPNGRREGLLKNKHAYLVITSGGTKLNSSEDFLTPWLKFILNFFGIEKVDIISADQMALDYEKSIKEAEAQIENLFKELSNKNYSIVFFISPKKIIKIIDIIKEYFSGRNILICREISKFYEEYLRSSVENLSKISIKDKGEITVVISELLEKQKKLKELKESDKKKIKSLIKKMTIKNIIKVIGAESNISKKEIYNYCLSIKNEDK